MDRPSMAHIFVVNSDTLPIHMQRGFAGIVRSNGYGWYGQLADLMNLRVGDLVYFYCAYLDKKKLFWPENAITKGIKPGYWGIFRVISHPFEDCTDVSGTGAFDDQWILGSHASPRYKNLVSTKVARGIENVQPKVLPIRVLIEPVRGLHYSMPIDDTTAYVDKSDEGVLWTLFFKKISKDGQARGITPLLPEEADKIARLLYRDNELSPKSHPLPSPLQSVGYPSVPRSFIRLNYADLLHKQTEGSVCHENVLVAWIMANIDKGQPVLREISEPLGDIEFAGNHVQYGINGETVDVLLLHRRHVSATHFYRHRATVMEVKRDTITPTSVAQVARYAKWIAQLTTFNNISVIQPVIIGKGISRNSVSGIKHEIEKLERMGIRTPWFLSYEATPGGISLTWLHEPLNLTTNMNFELLNQPKLLQ